MSTMSQQGKTWFQVAPSPHSRKVMFRNCAFDLDDVVRVTEPGMLYKNVYIFKVLLSPDNAWLEFDFDKKAECLSAQRELCRAWAEAGEFNPNGEQSS